MRVKYLILFTIFIVSCSPQSVETPIHELDAISSTPIRGVDTFAPAPTSTPSTIDKIFVIPTQQGYFPSTPIPIATPEFGPSSFTLRNLSEDDFIDLIDDMERYSYQNFPPFMDWQSEGLFKDSQRSLAILLQEYLYHFPSSTYSERLHWQMVLIDFVNFEGYSFDGVGGNLYDDHWLVNQLEISLNNGITSPSDLETLLDKYWLDVEYIQPVENLFGDGKIAWFYVITPKVWQHEESNINSADYFRRGGLFFVVREIVDGTFQLFMLDNAISFSNGASSLFDISDHNRNGTPEIAISVGYHSGTMCAGDLRIYEWQVSAFQELTRGEIGIGDCIEHYDYFLSNNIPAIRLTEFFPNLESVFVWNGDYYEFLGYEYSDLIEKWRTIAYDSKASRIDEIDVIEEILSSEIRSDLTSAQVDFLRFRLGLAHALNSNPLQARKVLQDLESNPADTSRTVYSLLARKFVSYYSGDMDLYIACQKSREKLDEIWRPLDYEEEIEEFGFSDDPSSPFAIGLLRCFGGDVFEVLVSKTPIALGDFPEELNKNGINFYYAEKQDVNLDGLNEEWLVIFDGGVYLVFPKNGLYHSFAIDSFWGGETFSRVQVHVERVTELQKVMLIVSIDGETSIYVINDDFTSEYLVSFYNAEDMTFLVDGNPAQIQVFYGKPSSDQSYYATPWQGYRWDSADHKFHNDLLEYAIFIGREPRRAAGIADNVLPLFFDWVNSSYYTREFPRYLYLFGLSYELADQSQKAAEVYWQLWHDFPNSQYALMARYKIELANP